MLSTIITHVLAFSLGGMVGILMLSIFIVGRGGDDDE